LDATGKTRLLRLILQGVEETVNNASFQLNKGARLDGMAQEIDTTNFSAEYNVDLPEL